MADRPASQKRAEKSYRDSFAATVLVRFTKDEAKLIDAVRGEESRATWLKAKGLAAAKRAK